MSRTDDEPRAGPDRDALAARLARVRRLSADGRQPNPKAGWKLSEALGGVAVLAFLLGVIRPFLIGDRLGFIATTPIGQVGCFAAALVALRGDRDRLRLAVLMALGYVLIFLAYAPFLVPIKWWP